MNPDPDTTLDSYRPGDIVAMARAAGDLYVETWIAVVLAPFYGAIAFAPLFEVALVEHSRWTPFWLGALFSFIVPILFRVWQGKHRAHRAIAFIFTATPVTLLLYHVSFDQFPRVRGRLLPVVEVALVAVGAAGIALALTWHLTDDDGESSA